MSTLYTHTPVEGQQICVFASLVLLRIALYHNLDFSVVSNFKGLKV
jgi:hypothetical protein